MEVGKRTCVQWRSSEWEDGGHCGAQGRVGVGGKTSPGPPGARARELTGSEGQHGAARRLLVGRGAHHCGRSNPSRTSVELRLCGRWSARPVRTRGFLSEELYSDVHVFERDWGVWCERIGSMGGFHAPATERAAGCTRAAPCSCDIPRPADNPSVMSRSRISQSHCVHQAGSTLDHQSNLQSMLWRSINRTEGSHLWRATNSQDPPPP